MGGSPSRQIASHRRHYTARCGGPDATDTDNLFANLGGPTGHLGLPTSTMSSDPVSRVLPPQAGREGRTHMRDPRAHA